MIFPSIGMPEQIYVKGTWHSLIGADKHKSSRRKKKDDVDRRLQDDSASIISHLSQCFGDYSAMVGSRTWFGEILHRARVRRYSSDKFIDFALSPLQEQRLQKLKGRMHTSFDPNRADHQVALKALWRVAFPNVQLNGLISEQWKDMGWQGSNPSTDFRGCGFLALENLLYLAKTYPVAFQRLLLKQEGERASWEYPFAVAGVNVTFMLIQMLDLSAEKPKCTSGRTFMKMLEEDEDAFDILYCIAFAMVDAEWLAMDASYMQFKEVLEVTRKQLERELSLEDVHRISDLPAYNLLCK